VTVDSEDIGKIKKNRKILQEGENFELLKYLYHKNQLDEEKLKLMDLNIENNHPSFDVMTRTYVNIPDVQRVNIKFKENMQLKDMTFVGISNDPNSNFTLKSISDKDKEF